MKYLWLRYRTGLVLLVFLSSCGIAHKQAISSFPSMPVVPTSKQVTYQQMEFIGFIHFTVNTFTDKEWGYGNEDPSVFNPSALDVEQWVATAKEAGMKQLILTAKHHDGFCLWPTKFNEHNITQSPYQDGKGDIVREFVDACAKYGIKAGLYLSPWDRNHKDYGRSAYITYYRNQLQEILTQYGEISEIWFDGANGGDGYYGGANETRKIDNKTYYDWDSTFALVRKLQPNIMIFSDAGPDVHWIGNEKGFAGDPFWSTIDGDSLIIGNSNQSYLNSGDPEGTDWMVGQCDVSIRPGWFYHRHEDDSVKTLSHLLDIYYQSVGRNCVLLLNLPPDQRGLIHENDVAVLREFKSVLDETFATNLLQRAKLTLNSCGTAYSDFVPEYLWDDDLTTYWAAKDTLFPAEVVFSFDELELFDRIMIQEPIHLGQRVQRFQLEVQQGDNWKVIYEGSTIGYKRLVRIAPIYASKLRLKVLAAKGTTAVADMGLYLASEKEIPFINR